MAKPKRKRKAKAAKLDARFARPTPERESQNTFAPAGPARRVTLPIDTMLKQGVLTQSEHAALIKYRQQVDACERSPSRDSCDFSVRGGSGDGPGFRIMAAKDQRDRLERLMGSLTPIARFIAVDDKTVQAWLIEQYGGREKYKGEKVVSIEPRCNTTQAAMARWELKFAARRMMD